MDATSTLGVVPGSFSPFSSEASLAGQQILSILNELNSLTIDGRVFESAVFGSLVDYTIATTTEPIRRPDPFAPLPFESQMGDNEK